MVKERRKERKEKEKKKIQPASVTSDDVTAKRFSRGLIKKGVERREKGVETEKKRRAPSSLREKAPLG